MLQGLAAIINPEKLVDVVSAKEATKSLILQKYYEEEERDAERCPGVFNYFYYRNNYAKTELFSIIKETVGLDDFVPTHIFNEEGIECVIDKLFNTIIK